MQNISSQAQSVNKTFEGQRHGGAVSVTPSRYRPTLQQQQADAYRDWLSKYLWTNFFTLTFKPTGPTGSCHPERGDKIFDKFLDLLNQTIWGRHYKKKYHQGVIVARAVEKGKKGGLLHYHAVAGRIPEHITCEIIEAIWKEVGGGFCRIEKVRSRESVVQYMAKGSYLFKHGEIDLFPQGGKSFWWDDLEKDGQSVIFQ